MEENGLIESVLVAEHNNKLGINRGEETIDIPGEVARAAAAEVGPPGGGGIVSCTMLFETSVPGKREPFKSFYGSQ